MIIDYGGYRKVIATLKLRETSLLPHQLDFQFYMEKTNHDINLVSVFISDSIYLYFFIVLSISSFN